MLSVEELKLIRENPKKALRNIDKVIINLPKICKKHISTYRP